MLQMLYLASIISIILLWLPCRVVNITCLVSSELMFFLLQGKEIAMKECGTCFIVGIYIDNIAPGTR